MPVELTGQFHSMPDAAATHTSRTAASRAVRKRATILEAASRIFATRVYHLVTMDEVARAAGNDHYRLIANTGAGAGQTVFHTHFHVLGGAAGMTEHLI